MLNNKILEKLLAIILIFTLTFANFAFVSKSYAASFAETIFGGRFDTGNKNVEFEAYFETEDEETTSVISDVNNEDLSISMDLNVKEEGYLKDAKIEITEAKEGEGLNFDLKEKTELEEGIRNIEDNTVYLNQINKSSEVKIQIPIEYKNEEYVKEEKASGEAKVRFSGTYVDEDGEEKEVEKEVEIKVSWKDEREVKVEEEASKYITYGEGVILQTVERVDNGVEEGENTLPVKSTELEIEVPVLKDKKPSKITVVANKAEGTTGEEAGEIEFNEENWEYNEEENKLRIKLENEKQIVEVKEEEGEYLQEEGEKKEEERLYNGSGVDEYLVTYTYEEVEVGEEEAVEVRSKTKAIMTTVSGVEGEENKNIVEAEKENTYELKGTTGEIVSLNVEGNKKEISKAYTYVNYNNEGRYEVEIENEMIVNVSYKDIVEGIEVKDEANTYVDKEGKEIENNDIYYKRIAVRKENFESILGENGEIKVKDEAGNEVGVINKESEVNEEGNIEISFVEKYSRLSFETSKAEGEGNLVIKTVKGISGASVDKGTYGNIEKIKTRTTMEAKYDYVEEKVNVGSIETEEKLVDTATNANLIIDRESLSTIEANTDVEMRIELNNANEKSDIYGASEFEIELPEYVENVEVTNISLLYGEGLEITGSSVEGRRIRVSLGGKQEGINSGVLTNGTNIVMNANIKVNMYAPAKEEKIVLRYTNSEATNYVDGGVEEVGIEYSAPTGLVAVNRVTNFDEAGTVVESIRQGKKEGIIGVYGGEITAREELIVMNNNRNSVSNMKILGRIPYAGVKDLESKEEIGTTVDTKLAGQVEVSEENRGSFKVYYSENGEATEDLGDANNGWTESPANIESIKSYLIIPEENYEMQENEILRFAYNFVVPENLTHNENIYGTFGVYYRNNSELSQSNEIEIANIVGLSTGAGPELEISIEDVKDVVKENEEFEVNISVSNVGENVAENVNIEVPIPAGSEYSRYEIDVENAVVTEEKDRLLVSLEKVEIGQNIKLKVYLVASPLSSLGEYSKTITPTVNLTAKDLMTVLSDTANTVQIDFAEFYILEEGNGYTKIEKPGTELLFRTTVINSSTETKNNVVITKTLPKEFSLVDATEGYSYDENTNTITWNVGNIEKLDKITLDAKVVINDFDSNIGKLNVLVSSKVKAENSDEYESNKIITVIGKPILSITQTTDNVNTYVKEGDSINYTFTIKNEGSVTATNVKLRDEIPEGIQVTNIKYLVGDKEVDKLGNYEDGVEVEVNIAPGQEWKLNVLGRATSIGASDEQSVTNYATMSNEDVAEIKSNSITHIIESSGDTGEVHSAESSSSPSPSKTLTSSRTYKVSGTAWVDENQDGMRNNDEKLLTSILVRLVNSETGVVEQSITTDSQGKYNFSGVANGNYLVLFEYDTATYKVTTYQKEGVASNVNSDVISTTIEKDGKSKEGAVTDVIKVNGGSISNIDLGLILANTFDLKLDKTISKVMVQTSNGTTTENYNNVSLAKADIAAKYLSGATVFVEYTFTISNVGDYAGYAKKIVDYIPDGMMFNSTFEENKNWYTGSDGNLYSEAIANKELKSGDTATLKLILTKQMTEENTGLVNNIAEIYEDYNTYGVSDINSTPKNKAQGENDMSSADISILIRTGETLIYVSVIITSILLAIVAIFVTHNRIVASKRKGGV